MKEHGDGKRMRKFAISTRVCRDQINLWRLKVKKSTRKSLIDCVEEVG